MPSRSANTGLISRSRRSSRGDQGIKAALAPGGGVGEQGSQQAIVQPVARAVRDEAPMQRAAGQRQIADRVDQLMAGEFILHPQPARD